VYAENAQHFFRIFGMLSIFAFSAPHTENTLPEVRELFDVDPRFHIRFVNIGEHERHRGTARFMRSSDSQQIKSRKAKESFERNLVQVSVSCKRLADPEILCCRTESTHVA
jgi:hypothetical protein